MPHSARCYGRREGVAADVERADHAGHLDDGGSERLVTLLAAPHRVIDRGRERPSPHPTGVASQLFGQDLEPKAHPLPSAVDVHDQLLRGVPQERCRVEGRFSDERLWVQRDKSAVGEHEGAEVKVPVQQHPLSLGRSERAEQIHGATHELALERPPNPDVARLQGGGPRPDLGGHRRDPARIRDPETIADIRCLPKGDALVGLRSERGAGLVALEETRTTGIVLQQA